MSLKDAIREAADERSKQVSASPGVASPNSEIERQKPLLPSAKPEGSKPQEPRGRGAKASVTPVSPSATPSARHISKSSKAVIAASNNTLMHASNARKDQNKGGAASEDELIETAAMTVRVPRQHRIHWLISAKKQGTSLTAAITEALNARFGEPTD